MTWPWSKPTSRKGERPVACPACMSTLPHAPLLQLASSVIRKGRVVTYVSGQELSCSACGRVFAVGPDGTFFRDARAFGVRAPAENGETQRPARSARETQRTEASLRSRGPMTPLEPPAW